MKKVNIFILVLLTFLLCNSNITIASSEEYNNYIEVAPLTREYRNNSKDNEVTPPIIRAEKENTMINTIDTFSSIITDVTSPSSFRLKNNSGGNLLSVKNQGTSNICWAFAGTSTLESNLRLSIDNYTNYSPYHINNSLAYTYSSGQNNYGNKTNNTGGNFEDDMLYWTSNLGPVSSFQNSTTLRTMASTMVTPSSVSVDKIYLLDKFYNTLSTTSEKAAFRSQIKELIQKYGAVYIHAAAPQNSHFNSTYNSVYTTSVTSYNNNAHALAIVGWDDSFSRYKFNTSNGSYPSIDGAWIVQNSWGSSYGNSGYYYYSYEDYMIGVFASGVYGTSEKVYDNTYQYNPTGDITYINSKYIANVYNKIEDKNEAITSVGIFAYAPNTKVNIYINVNGSKLANATKVNSSPITIEYAGYYTYYLDEYLSINGNSFAVIIEYLTYDPNSQTYKYSSPIHLYSHNSLTKEQVGILPKQSYISNNKSTWTDLYNYSYVGGIKVHTVNVGTNSKGIETFLKNSTLSSGDKVIYLNTYTNNISNASSVTYKVTDYKGADVTSKFKVYDSKVVNNFAIGILTASSTLSDGVYTVTATSSNVSNSKMFIVGDGYTTSLLHNTAVIGTGHSRDLSLYIDSYETLSWKSSNTNVATVKNGIVTGVAPGSANIVINNTYTIKVTVKDPIYISSASEFLNIRNDLDEYYVLNNDIDFSGMNYTTIGSSSSPFTGIISGNNHIIKNITLNGSNYASIIGYTKGGALTNVGFENITLNGSNYVGIIGYASYSDIDNVYLFNSNIKGSNNVGGIVGYSNSSIINNSFNISKITGTSYVGGIIGYSNSSIIKKTYNTGIVTGSTSVGGINGVSFYSAVSEVYNEGNITASTKNVGGIVGTFNTSSLNNSYNNGKVTGTNSGGIIGELLNSNTIIVNNTYNIGTVSGSNAGGIIGYGVANSSTGTISNNYDISDSIPVFGSINLAYTDSKELSNMKDNSNYVNFDFNNIWKMNGYPILNSIIHPTNIILSNTSYTINVGEKIKLDATIVSNSINKISVYSLNNDNVIISNGYLVANKVGNTTVTISTTNNIKKTFNVNIVNILDTGDYDFEDGFISGISPGTNYNNFIEDLSANTINLYANGKVVNDINTIIGTNMKIEVSNGTEKMTYTLIVRGDVNGDGYVKMNDVMDIAKYIVELDGISGNYLVAADVTKDDNVKMNDVMKIAKYLVEGGTL